MRMRMVLGMRGGNRHSEPAITRSESSVAPFVALFFGRPIRSPVGLLDSAHSRTWDGITPPLGISSHLTKLATANKKLCYVAYRT